MFRDRMANWARMLDVFACAMSTFAVLARVRGGALFVGNYRNRAAPVQTHINPRQEVALAMAYMQMSRLNR
jgi:hypothetical protein